MVSNIVIAKEIYKKEDAVNLIDEIFVFIDRWSKDKSTVLLNLHISVDCRTAE